MICGGQKALITDFYNPSANPILTCAGTQGGAPFWGAGDEIVATEIIRDILRAEVPKLLQNGPFDLRFFEREKSTFVSARTAFGWEVRNFAEDTMQMHKAIAGWILVSCLRSASRTEHRIYICRRACRP